MQQKRPAKMGREAPHFVDEAVLLHFALFWGNPWLVTFSVKDSTYIIYTLHDTLHDTLGIPHAQTREPEVARSSRYDFVLFFRCVSYPDFIFGFRCTIFH